MRNGTLCVMLDCSRNAVMSVDGVKDFIDKLSLMGYNALMLYTEDTYEIPEEPLFGYMRGRYTRKQLKALDSYFTRLYYQQGNKEGLRDLLIDYRKLMPKLEELSKRRGPCGIRDINPTAST